MESVVNFLNAVDDVLYYPILILILLGAGIYFSIRTKFAQIRLVIESIRVIKESSGDKNKVSPFQALMVSTASRVGTGNIIGVSTAICLGGPGAVFWMWVLAILGGASAFIESTLAQIYKRHNQETGGSYGGPAYYIEQVLKNRWVAVLFSIFLIATYGFGFNLLTSYNLQSTFVAYSFYDVKITPIIIGTTIAILTAICLFSDKKRGSGQTIINVTSYLVPSMGVLYVCVTIVLMLINIHTLPEIFKLIFSDAFNFKAIGSGLAGSCLVYGIKRGLYSNEAGVGSAPNAAAAANTSHPVKQGLVQMLSVYIDTLLICTATAFMCLMSQVPITHEVAGAPYVQTAMSTNLGAFGPIFLTVAMVLFAFTTLLGNLFYMDNVLTFINNKKMPSKTFITFFRIGCVLVIFFGAITPMSMAWAFADITMGGMALINIPSIVILGGVAYKALADYEKQRKEGKNPVFLSKNIGMDPDTLDYWK